jgi:hypothetical protein
VTDKTVKDFIKGKTGGYWGTHQVNGEKIKFGLGDQFNAKALASTVKNSKE